MGKKLTGILLLITGTVVMVTAMNQSFINKIKHEKYFDHIKPSAEKRNAVYETLFIKTDRWRYGDLYGLCYLPEYKFPLEAFKIYKHKAGYLPTNKVLYIIGDSFLADKDIYGALDSFDNIVYLDRRSSFGPTELDSSKQNYLMLEFAERNLNNYDISLTEEVLVPDKVTETSLPIRKKDAALAPQALPTTISARLNNILFNKDLNRNLEMLLFDNKLATPFKELKASLNYSLFKRLPAEVAVSTDKSRLFLNITVDTASNQSAFRLVTDKEVERLSQNLRNARKYYLALGFKDVFLSGIPNSVTVYDDKRGTYNHLLQRVEAESGLKCVSLLEVYKNSKANVFYRSDAHWNPTGLDIWVNQTNAFLQQNTH